eukprot:scaffold413887_cov26-Prasinocladus_malaysianus.AAC.1
MDYKSWSRSLRVEQRGCPTSDRPLGPTSNHRPARRGWRNAGIRTYRRLAKPAHNPYPYPDASFIFHMSFPQRFMNAVDKVPHEWDRLTLFGGPPHIMLNVALEEMTPASEDLATAHIGVRLG